MRLADVVFRRGHLSERALTDICLSGDRPAHLDQCDICAERAVALGRWLDDIRATAIEESDTAFPPERLAAQQAQIMRRLEHIDRPVRVIAFPGQSRDRAERAPRGVRPAWLGIAAAAGVILGLLGGQLTSRLTAHRPAEPLRAAVTVQQPAAGNSAAQVTSYVLPDLDLDDKPFIEEAAALDAYTPHVISRAEQIVLRTTR